MTCPIQLLSNRIKVEAMILRECSASAETSAACRERISDSIGSIEEVARELAAISERMNAAGKSAKFGALFSQYYQVWHVSLDESFKESTDAHNRAKHLTGLYANLLAENDGLIKERTDRAAYVTRLEKDLLTGDNYRCERCRKVFHYLDMHYVGDDRCCDSCLPQAKAEDAAAEREERSIDADMCKLHNDNMRGKP